MSRRLLGSVEEKERDRELAVRTVVCPVCQTKPGHACVYGLVKDRRPARARRLNRGPVSHTGRYEVAATAGLVPALRGWQQSGGVR